MKAQGMPIDDATGEEGKRPARPLFPIPSPILRAVDGVNALSERMIAGMLGALVVLGSVQVVSRYLFSSPLTWTEEVIRYGLIWMVFLGSGVCTRKGALATLDLVVMAVPDEVQFLFRCFVLLAATAFWAVICVFGHELAWNFSTLSGGTTGVSMGLIYAAIPIGALLSIINLIAAAADPR